MRPEIIAVCCFKDDRYRWFDLPYPMFKASADEWARRFVGTPAENYRHRGDEAEVPVEAPVPSPVDNVRSGLILAVGDLGQAVANVGYAASFVGRYPDLSLTADHINEAERRIRSASEAIADARRHLVRAATRREG